MAALRGIYIVDAFNISNAFRSRLDQNGNMVILGESIGLAQDGNEPHHLKLADHDHVGTVGSGIGVNELVLPALASYGVNIPPFSDYELLTISGISVVKP